MRYGYQAVFDTGYVDALRYAAEHEFDYVQFDLNVPRFFLDHLSPRELQDIRRLASDLGVGLSFHAPGDNVSLFSDFPLIRKGILAQLDLILKRANEIGARHLTLHPGFPPSFRRADEQEDSFRRDHRDHYVGVLAENLQWISGQAGSVLVCVENYGLLSWAFDGFREARRAGAPLHLCWDIPKSHGEPESEALLRDNMELVREVHVHDVDPEGRQHRRVGHGIIRFERYLDVLRRADVAITIEVRPREEAAESRRTLSRLIDAASRSGAPPEV